MTDSTQPEALRLADELEFVSGGWGVADQCCAELRRQHARIAELEARVQEIGAMARENRSRRIVELEAQLEAVGAGGVSGPLMGQPQAMPDLSALTERGATAWAGIDAQALRDGTYQAATTTASSRPRRCGLAWTHTMPTTAAQWAVSGPSTG